MCMYEYVYQILVTKISNVGRINCIWTNLIPNVTALDSQQFTHQIIDRPLLAKLRND